MSDDAVVTEAGAEVVAEVVADPVVDPTPDPVVEAEPETPVARTIEQRVEVGSTIERTSRGWMAHLMYGGAVRVHGEGDTIEAAVAAAGA